MEVVYELNLPIEIISKIKKYLVKDDIITRKVRSHSEEIKWKGRHSQLKKYYEY